MPLMEAGRQPNSVGTEAVAAKMRPTRPGSPELADTHAIRKMFNQTTTRIAAGTTAVTDHISCLPLWGLW